VEHWKSRAALPAFLRKKHFLEENCGQRRGNAGEVAFPFG